MHTSIRNGLPDTTTGFYHNCISISQLPPVPGSFFEMLECISFQPGKRCVSIWPEIQKVFAFRCGISVKMGPPAMPPFSGRGVLVPTGTGAPKEKKEIASTWRLPGWLVMLVLVMPPAPGWCCSSISQQVPGG